MRRHFLTLTLTNFCFSLFFSICYSHDVNAWTYQGHATLTQASYQQLTFSQKQFYKDLAKQLKSKYNTSNSQKMTLLGTWADENRGDSLQELFSQYRQPVPRPLRQSAKFSTARWHYDNSFIQNDRLEKSGRTCEVKNKGELLNKLVLLDQLLFNPERHPGTQLSKKQEAIVLALQLHMLQDLHQPLHLISQLDHRCQPDLGGNTVCIAKATNGKCKLNLHAYWDKGFGVFDDVSSLSVPPKAEISQAKFSQEIQRWAEEGKQYTSVVYATDELPLTDKYEKKALVAVKNQAQLCVQRSVAYLKRYYHFRNTRR